MLDGFEKQHGGYLTKDDPADFSDKVALLLTDNNIYESKAKEARAKALEMSSGNIAKKMLTIYDRVILEFKRKKAEKK